ncbi:hypothetical protein ABZ912_19800 [Nonomuraea angiospora]|uniref:hypothetical protein n=1 Tax=Nonomuraea angiospora TaxID=46172 RepID=UPI0033F3543F
MSDTTTHGVPDLEAVRGRLYDLRLYGPEALYSLRPVVINIPAELHSLSTLIGKDVPGLIAAVERLQAQRDRLLALHKYDELLFGGVFICLHCTPNDCDDPDLNVVWPCPSLRAAGVDNNEGSAIILAHRAEIARQAAQEVASRG